MLEKDKKLIEKAQGSLVGLACGDAVGTTLEFKLRGTFTPIDDINTQQATDL